MTKTRRPLLQHGRRDGTTPLGSAAAAVASAADKYGQFSIDRRAWSGRADDDSHTTAGPFHRAAGNQISH